MKEEPVRIAVIGCGNRGRHLAGLALKCSADVLIVALVDSDPSALDRTGAALRLSGVPFHASHRDLLGAAESIDVAIVATEVRTHAAITRDLLDAGVPVFLEKPITRTIEEAVDLYRLSARTGVPIFVGFNLRYSPFYRKLKQIVDEGAVGEVISIEWKEVLSAAAWADGYCRASWYSRTDSVGGWLLEKSCHDIDQINWIAGSPCRQVASFGSRRLFVPRDDVPSRCTEGCPRERECYFSCLKLHPDGPSSLPSYVPPERWDLCVYHSGSDLMDRQVAILEYENGVTAAFSILPIGNRWERLMRISGSEATLRGSDGSQQIHLYRHDTLEPIVYDVPKEESGHGGADPKIVQDLVEFARDPTNKIGPSMDVGLESMLSAGGIERARERGMVVELAPIRRQARADG